MEDKNIKTSRASQTRDKIEVKKVWTPPNSLDAPPAPTGYRHQWIRAEVLGFNDAKINSFMIYSTFAAIIGSLIIGSMVKVLGSKKSY